MERRESEQMEQGAQQPEQAQRSPERSGRREQGGAEAISQTLRVIETIEHKLSDAYRVPLRKNMCVVDTSELADLLGQLRMALPKAVAQAQSVLANREQIIANATAQADKIADDADRIYGETVAKAKQFKDDVESEADAYDKNTRQKAQEDAQAIVADAQTRAEQILFGAQHQAQKMVDENEITRRAQAYAMETRERAEKDADSIYSQACVHTDKMLSGAAAALSRSANDLAVLRDSLLGQGQPQER